MIGPAETPETTDPSGPLDIEGFVEDDDLIAATRTDGATRMRVYRLPSPVVVLGRGSDPGVELDVDACVRDRIPVLRRRGGGCAVVIDPGNVIVSVTTAMSGLAGHRIAFERISAWLVDALARMGIPGVRREGSSDLALGDRKVAGACIYRPRDSVYYSASVLVKPDVSLVERYLRHPPREPEYRRGRSHREFMGALGVAVGVDDGAIFERRLRASLADAPL